ncbi:NAD(P)H-dependent oxidoreductase [Companilactobacillus sp. DQM5]|uniref:NAD(P)H-dependent oxidoreductase n=1 Tax=Companilactobacillus sp. DQM5 TaxID=3463359 RepID=UPI0040590624
MKTLVIVSHPEIKESSTQSFLKASFPNNHNVTYHFIDEIFDKEQDRQLLLENDRIVFQFPLYWYSAPANLKRWIDEVLDGDFAFSGNKPLQDKEFALVISTGIAKKDFSAGSKEKYSISEMLKPFEMMANKLDMKYLAPFIIYQFEYLTDRQKQALVTDYQRYLMQEKFDFDSEIKWFIDELTNKKQDLLAETLKAKQEELNDLTWQVKSMREDDGEG